MEDEQWYGSIAIRPFAREEDHDDTMLRSVPSIVHVFMLASSALLPFSPPFPLTDEHPMKPPYPSIPSLSPSNTNGVSHIKSLMVVLAVLVLLVLLAAALLVVDLCKTETRSVFYRNNTQLRIPAPPQRWPTRFDLALLRQHLMGRKTHKETS